MTRPTNPRGLMDPNWRYVRAAETNLEKTFARIRRQQKQAQAEAEAAKQAANVKPIRKVAK